MRRPSHRRHDRNWPRQPRWRSGSVTLESTTQILKRLYVSVDTPEMAAPWFVELARARHWASPDVLRKIPLVPTGRTLRGIGRMLSEPSPFFGLIRKDTSFTSQETA